MNIKFDINVKTLIAILLMLIVIIFMIKLQSIITIFSVSFLISYILIPFVHFLEIRFKFSRLFSVMVIFATFFIIMAGFLIFLLPFLYYEVWKLISNIPVYLSIFMAKIEDVANHFGYTLDFSFLKEFLISKLNDNSGVFIKKSLAAAGNILDYISSLLGLMIVPILVFYFLKDFEVVLGNLIKILKSNTGIDFDYYNEQFNSILKKYFRGQLLVCFALSIMYGLVNFLIGIKGGFIIGLLAGFLSFIPYLGFIAGIVTSVIFAYLQFLDILHPIFVIAGFGIVQVIESYILTPKLIGESLGLHPTVVIFSLLAGAYLLGIGGMIISIPVAAFIKIVGMRLTDSKLG
ncbi:MAG: AI-2E family transporter [Calditerrivibrio sp.]|nr:AI-2E family transporter [Calditerrivibrio sp.]